MVMKVGLPTLEQPKPVGYVREASEMPATVRMCGQVCNLYAPDCPCRDVIEGWYDKDFQT